MPTLDMQCAGTPTPLNGRTRLFVILGDPIAQVGSPALFNDAFRRRGAGAVLVPAHVKADDLGLVMGGLRSIRNLDGIIVTVPHKVAVMDFVDDVSASAQRVGAVNAIRKLSDGRLVGDNFDGKGCVRGLSNAGLPLAGQRILVVGGGGAGRAVAHAMAEEKPACLHLFDTDQARQDGVLHSLRLAHPHIEVAAGVPDPAGFDVVVNCTPLGTKPGDPPPFPTERLACSMLVVDIVLNDASRLISAALASGCKVQPGSRMLEGQVDAICEFFGVRGAS